MKYVRFLEAKLRETKTKYTMSDIKMPLPDEVIQHQNKENTLTAMAAIPVEKNK